MCFVHFCVLHCWADAKNNLVKKCQSLLSVVLTYVRIQSELASVLLASETQWNLLFSISFNSLSERMKHVLGITFHILRQISIQIFLLEIETILILTNLNHDFFESIQKTTAPMKIYQCGYACHCNLASFIYIKCCLLKSFFEPFSCNLGLIPDFHQAMTFNPQWSKAWWEIVFTKENLINNDIFF